MNPEISLPVPDLPPIVLLVDSDRNELEEYSACFEHAGMWVATTTIAEEVLPCAEELKPDVIVAQVPREGNTAMR